jgi:hypothetical protein
MKTKPTILSFLACLSISASSLNAQSIPEPVLNIQAGKGMAVDKSEKARELTELPAGSNNTCVALNSEKAIEIPYAEGDPLFSIEEFTWVLRVKFTSFGAPSQSSPVMGRWFPASNDRSVGLLLGADQLMKFGICADGTIKGVRSESLSVPIPADNWRIFVFRWKAGQLASLSLFSNEGKRLQTHNMGEKFILPSIKQVNQPFLVGAPADYGMEIKAVKVFDRALTEEELTADLLTK